MGTISNDIRSFEFLISSIANESNHNRSLVIITFRRYCINSYITPPQAKRTLALTARPDLVTYEGLFAAAGGAGAGVAVAGSSMLVGNSVAVGELVMSSSSLRSRYAGFNLSIETFDVRCGNCSLKCLSPRCRTWYGPS